MTGKQVEHKLRSYSLKIVISSQVKVFRITLGAINAYINFVYDLTQGMTSTIIHIPNIEILCCL